MEVPCVRVALEHGEATRAALADADLIDDGYEIAVEDSRIYIPIADPDGVSDVLEAPEIVPRTVAERESQTTPADLLAFEPTYERLGRAALIDEDDPDRARAIADAILESDLPVETVLNKASKVKGETRVRDWELLAGENTEVVHREYGCEFLLDLSDVYFSPRLATERHRVAEQVTADEHAFDMFAGVGPFVVPFAKRGAECVGVDINPEAVDYLRENARRNGVEDRVTAINDDVRTVTTEYENWADRIVMNLPHSADDFLESAVTLAGDDCTIHYYDIQHEDDPFGPGERAIRAAADPDYEVTVETRHTVRSYAPHELNVCLDVRLER
ncbi:class I SAM-dependent methyltransferase family protein [Natrinema versiforme]|uniref:Class I SAM-dependent methyltransferase family protein n=1 Tax=Natrinema versiforme TaxID=88724 RepID=A0A4P8WEN8_9EURY|nr:class I SAM-dependent methyltransferase family protein [Natrinema versiforme]QCS41739.1 class I SAM-dependent methyltransferase family protein [Natrinema versiforme]